jgi:hypothetical protein
MAGVQVTQDTCDAMLGLNGLCEAIDMRVGGVKEENRDRAAGVYKHAAPSPPWPGGYLTYAMLVLICWSFEKIDGLLRLLCNDECVSHLTVIRGWLLDARDVFENCKHAFVDAGTPQFVFGLAQAHAASISWMLHDPEFWGQCKEVRVALGVDFDSKGKVFASLSTFGKMAAASCFTSKAGATDWGPAARDAAGAQPGTTKWQAAGGLCVV